MASNLSKQLAKLQRDVTGATGRAGDHHHYAMDQNQGSAQKQERIAMKVTSDDDYDTVFSALKSQRVLDETGRIIPEPEDIEVVRAEHPARSEEALLQLVIGHASEVLAALSLQPRNGGGWLSATGR